MGETRSRWTFIHVLVTSVVFAVVSLIFLPKCQALTASYGRPYHGYLENGVVFPSQFPGYHLRDENRSYTTPEVVGALLDAIEGVRTQFPGTCDVFLGDFSCSGGGSAIHHRSHQNGRDVDIGLYAKGNRPLNGFTPMGEDNLDAAKTWCLIENLISSQRVQYIFLDRRVQKVIYEYAASQGYEKEYLNRVFGNVQGSLIQHVKNHVDHMHVRFFTPWSTLASHIGSGETEKQEVIAVAQQSYLPKKVNYYVTGSEKGLDELARSFGVTLPDLCRWNHISSSSVLVPGSCMVFYKRSFESEPVQLARSLQPGFIAQASPMRVASVQPESVPSVSDSVSASYEEEPVVKEKKERPAVPAASHHTYFARKGDTIEKIARRNNWDVKLLCRLNGVSKSAHLRPGQKVRTASATNYAEVSNESAGRRQKASSSICFASDLKKPGSLTAAYYTVNSGGSLKDISKKTGISLSTLCQLNGLKRNAQLKPGQRIKLTQANLPVQPTLGKASCSIKAKEPVGKASSTKRGKTGNKASSASKRNTKSAAVKKSAVKQAVKSGKSMSAETGKKNAASKPGKTASANSKKTTALAKR